MADEGRGIALAILGIVAVIAVVGLVLLFKGGTGQIYGGDLTRVPGEDLYQQGYEPPRYTSPVPSDEGGTYYDYRRSVDRPTWEYGRDACPDQGYSHPEDIASVGARTDCVPSTVQDQVFCCPLGGSAGWEREGVAGYG